VTAIKTKRHFVSLWDEALYLYDKMLFWWYNRANRARARHFADRLQHVLQRLPRIDYPARVEEFWSLIYDIRGDLDNAIAHRRNEIEVISSALDGAHGKRPTHLNPGSDTYQDLVDRLMLLALLYRDQGNDDSARASLHQARDIAAKHHFEFEYQDVLDELDSGPDA